MLTPANAKLTDMMRIALTQRSSVVPESLNTEQSGTANSSRAAVPASMIASVYRTPYLTPSVMRFLFLVPLLKETMGVMVSRSPKAAKRMNC